MDTSRILVTGGAGFLGTNLVGHLLELGHDVLSLDIKPARNPEHASVHSISDLLDADSLNQTVADFSPHVIFHLGARTDLDGPDLAAYAANTKGVRNMIEAARQAPELRRIVFASTMLVCRLGYTPTGDEDYCPSTIYGASKVEGERLVRTEAGELPWTIMRPTSLWGPWFDVPYRSFFDAVREGWYLHPKGRSVYRSYGFVLNSVMQLNAILDLPEAVTRHRTFYLADERPLELRAWAEYIRAAFGVGPVKEVPMPVLKAIALAGDILQKVGWRRPPLTSFRLNNMITNAIFDTQYLLPIHEDLPYDVESAVNITVDWLKSNERTGRASS